MEEFIERHGAELMMLVLSALVLGTLLVLVPQLLRAHQRTRECQHEENMRALENGHRLPPPDPGAWAAGRTATLVPIVSVISACTVTCFLISFKSENVFSVALAVWCVAGVISLASVTGGVSLLARLAQLNSGDIEDADEEEAPVSE